MYRLEAAPPFRGDREPSQEGAARWTGRFGRHSVSIDADCGSAHLLRSLLPPMSPSAEAPALGIGFRSDAPDPRNDTPPEWQVAAHWARGEQLRVRGQSGARSIFDPYSRTVTTLRRGSGQVWFDLARSAPSWVLAAPALQLFDWWATAQDMLATHAAAIGIGSSGVLLVGAGGSGKSTFALESAERGHGFLGDDYVLIEPGITPRVHALYRSAKLARIDKAGPERFSLLAEANAEEDKHVFIADEGVPLSSAPLHAVIAPVIADAQQPRLVPITAAEAIRRAAPSILRQMPGMEAQKLALLAQTVRTLPCYRLELSPDHGRNIAAVERLIATGRPEV